ncbi:MAG TPA: isochorismatase family protein [Solirubrobacteraceae bacterium]|nr:isochorismatase family protein [Solirubrobacteraceae bacterium]
MSDARDVYGERGFGGRQGAGRHPALVIIDLNYAFTDPESPLHCDADTAVEATAQLLAAARERGRPVAFTTIEYDEGAKQVARAFIAKAPALAMMTPGSRWAQIDERIAPREDEPVLVKLFASAFFGTALQPMLTSAGADTLVVAGASTSGCVRATVVDGLQHGLAVVVPRDAVADRAQSAHEASLTDIDAKYGDVVSLDEAIAVLRSG